VRIGVDLGGTKIEIVALDVDGHERLRRRQATPKGDYTAILRMVAELVAAAETDLGTTATVGVGTPGAPSRVDGRIKNANSVWLNGQPLKQDLEVRLEREIRIANDANCFALSEAMDGAGAGCASVFGVIVGTGTGGGIAIDGHVVTGINAIAGEWGHNPLPWPQEDEIPGPPCYCGRYGCIETFLSGPGMAADHRRRTGRDMSPEAIVAAAEDSEPGAQASMARYEDRMARGLAHVINLLDPEVIVLGGGMANIARLYHRVPGLWPAYCFSDRVDTRLLPPRHGDSSGVRGAAWLWPAATGAGPG